MLDLLLPTLKMEGERNWQTNECTNRSETKEKVIRNGEEVSLSLMCLIRQSFVDEMRRKKRTIQASEMVYRKSQSIRCRNKKLIN